MTKRIIVEIAEGLGNQLFMYAHAYSMAKKLNYELFIDNQSGYSLKKNTLREHQKYMLDSFNIVENYAPNEFIYDKLLNIFNASGNINIFDEIQNIRIYSDNATYLKNKQEIFTQGNSKVIDLNNNISPDKCVSS